jgi:hypothetical protein
MVPTGVAAHPRHAGRTSPSRRTLRTSSCIRAPPAPYSDLHPARTAERRGHRGAGMAPLGGESDKHAALHYCCQVCDRLSASTSDCDVADWPEGSPRHARSVGVLFVASPCSGCGCLSRPARPTSLVHGQAEQTGHFLGLYVLQRRPPPAPPPPPPPPQLPSATRDTRDGAGRARRHRHGRVLRAPRGRAGSARLARHACAGGGGWRHGCSCRRGLQAAGPLPSVCRRRAASSVACPGRAGAGVEAGCCTRRNQHKWRLRSLLLTAPAPQQPTFHRRARGQATLAP